MLRTYLIFTLLCCFGVLQATTVTIGGRIIGTQEGVTIGVPNYPVLYRVSEANTEEVISVITDQEGFYTSTLDVTLTDNGGIPVRVIITDFCTGEELVIDVNAFASPANDVITITDVEICTDFNPPPPPPGCEAFFGAELDESNLTAFFFDISFSNEGEIITWNWDFGDGATSQEQNPSHTYNEEGIYDVTLTITTADSCTSTFVSPIFILPHPCDCFDIPYEIVCVQTPEGTRPFLNPCEALCQGFTQADFVECDDNIGCPCPEYYQPVCAIGANGDTLNFDNPCFAACEGFGEEDLFECDPNGCVCPDIYDPVCVATPSGGFITFSNACEAECEGFSPNDFFPCDSTSFCQAFFTFYPGDPDSTTNNPLTYIFNDLSFGTNISQIVAWEWTFSSDIVITEQNPVYTFPEPGEYEVCLTITSSDGCTSTICQPVRVGENNECNCPTDEYIPVCVILPDGSIEEFPSYCFAACFAGPLGLPIVDCDNNQFCQANFSYHTGDPTTDSVQVLTYIFEDFSSVTGTNEIVSWEWDFGDGTSSTEQNPIHTFPAEGDYEVCLTIVTSDGCTSITCQGIWVGDMNGCICEDIYDPHCIIFPGGEQAEFSNRCEAECFANILGIPFVEIIPCGGNPNCHAAFTFTVEEPGALSVLFSNQSYTGNDSTAVISYFWTFGDGSTSTEENPIYTYNEAGNYEVCLTITASNDCVSTFCLNVWIGETDPCNCPTDEYDPYCVVLPDGQLIELSNFCFAECFAGPLGLEIIDCDSTGCECTTEYNPVCAIGPNGDVITFSNACLARCAGYGADQIFECNGGCECPAIYDPVCVRSDDGVTLSFPNACEAECAGYGPDSFVECDNGVCSCPEYYDPVCVIDTLTGEIITFPNICFAECEGYTEVDVLEECNFGNPCDCTFELNPVCVTTATGIILTFPNPCVAECEGFGPNEYSSCDSIGFRNCFADFTMEILDDTGLTVQFTDLSSTSNDNDPIISWLWDLGNNELSEEQNPVVTYPEGGIFEVSLTIVTADSCISTTTQHVCVGDPGGFGGPACQAMFFFDQDLDDPFSFQFTDMSFGGATTWEWTFGDGSTSNEQNPTHTYAEPGVYFVSLSIAGEDCESTTAMIVLVGEDIGYNGACSALFMPFIDGETQTVFFLNLSSGDAVTYAWDFGDGTTSNEFITFHTYQQIGVYEASLTITSADGCESTFTATIDLGTNRITLSPVANANTTSTEEVTEVFEGVRMYPNPTNSTTQIEFTSNESKDYEVSILSMAGQQVYRSLETAQVGRNTLSISVNNLPEGMYITQIRSTEGLQSMKLIIQK